MQHFSCTTVFKSSQTFHGAINVQKVLAFLIKNDKYQDWQSTNGDDN